MATWLFKEEPDHYGFGELERDGRAVWNGVANNQALKFLRQVRAGDRIFYYHTGAERAIVGIMEATSDAYADPDEDDPKLAVVDVRPVGRLPRPVTLAEIKADQFFADWELVRIARLSIMPVSASQWKRIDALSQKRRQDG